MKILQENLDSIREQFESVIKYSQDLDIDINAADLFDKFLEEKSFFIKKFGGLIYEYPEKISLTVAVDNSLAAIINNLVDKILDYLKENENNLAPKTKIEIVLAALWLANNTDGFLDNKIVCFLDSDTAFSCNYSFFNSLVDDEEKRHYVKSIWKERINMIPKGIKLLKSLKFFITDKKALRNIQDLCSQKIQATQQIEGTLCLSVHPLDFLSLSENTYNWRSCHALDGEYRAGNVSYMMDSCTFIAYIKADGEYQLKNFPEEVKWNSKKLRRLFFLSNDRNMLFAGRSYPFECDALLDFVKDNIFNRYFIRKDPAYGIFHREYYWSDWSDETLDTYTDAEGEKTPLCEHYYHLGGYLKSRKDFIKDSKSALHYNDLLYSSCYTPKYSILMYSYKDETDVTIATIEGYVNKKYPSVSNATKFNIGGDCNCLHCGKKVIFDSGTFLCKECELEYGHGCQDLIAVCPVCGRRFDEQDGHWNSRLDELICPDCYQDYGEDEDYGD